MAPSSRNKLIYAALLLSAPTVVGLIMLMLTVHFFDTKEGIPIIMYLLSLAFLAFWAWVGSRFAALNIGKVYSFLLGNSTTFISCLVFYIFGEQAGADAISKWLSLLSGLFVLPVVSLSTGIVSLFVNLSASDYGIITYLVSVLLLVAGYSGGFFYNKEKQLKPF